MTRRASRGSSAIAELLVLVKARIPQGERVIFGGPSKHGDVGPTSVRRVPRQQVLTSARRRVDVVCSSARRRSDVGPTSASDVGSTLELDVGPTSPCLLGINTL